MERLELFSTGMDNKWDERIYVDLYAGSGVSNIKGTSTFLKGSRIIALTVACPFDRYIFCEEDEQQLTALRTRVARIAPEANVRFVSGNCDEKVGEIYASIPKASASNRESVPYLSRPEVIFEPVWALPDRTKHALGDAENSPLPVRAVDRNRPSAMLTAER